MDTFPDGGILRIDNCKELLVLSSTKTDYNSREPDSPLKNNLADLNRNILDAASRAGWKKLEQETAKYFSERMMRCQVDIGDTPAEIAQKTTPERIQLVKQGGKDPDLIEQLFQFGRYCIIANTRPARCPAACKGCGTRSQRRLEGVLFPEHQLPDEPVAGRRDRTGGIPPSLP